jgi:hypothetical protein
MKNLENNPNSVLKALEPFFEKKSDLFQLLTEDNLLLGFVGIGNLSDCYFKIVKYHSSQGKFFAQVAQKPADQNSVLERILNIQLDSVDKHMKVWTALLEERSRLYNVFSLNRRVIEIEDQFFNQSQYKEETFDFEYFSIDEAVEISNVCIQLLEFVENNQQIKNKSEIVKEINSLEENSAQESKRKLARRFAKIKALIVTNGPKLLKTVSDISVNVAGNVIAKMITG